jgi:hypothetical protein
MTDMKTWRERHDRFIAAIAARNAAQPAPATRGYSIAIRTAFRAVASSALTAIANTIGGPIPAPLVALWSAPVEGVAEYDASRSSNAFGRTLSLFTPSDAKQETLTLRALAEEFDFAPARNAIAFGWIQHEEAGRESNKSWLVLDSNTGAIWLIRAPHADRSLVATPVADSLDRALWAALTVGYWAGSDDQGLARYLDEVGDAITREERATVEHNAWVLALRAHR